MNTRPAASVGLGAGAEKLLESAVCVGSTKCPAPATAPKLTASLFSLLGPIQGHFSAFRADWGDFPPQGGSETAG